MQGKCLLPEIEREINTLNIIPKTRKQFRMVIKVGAITSTCERCCLEKEEGPSFPGQKNKSREWMALQRYHEAAWWTTRCPSLLP